MMIGHWYYRTIYDDGGLLRKGWEKHFADKGVSVGSRKFNTLVDHACRSRKVPPHLRGTEITINRITGYGKTKKKTSKRITLGTHLNY